jgi:hypothetical protein
VPAGGVVVDMPARLTMIVDAKGGVIEKDGYAADNGNTTFMSATDRDVLLGAYRALDKLGTENLPPHVTLLRRMIGHWAEHPSTLSLERQNLFDAKKSYTSLCGYCWYYVKFTHDCWGTDPWEDETTAYGLVAHIGAYTGCSSSTKYRSSDGVWHCLSYEPSDSFGWEYQKGNCYGRCGPGCSSEKDYTMHCGHHDHCVRNGHAMLSAWCEDEFERCIDDEALAPSCAACD